MLTSEGPEAPPRDLLAPRRENAYADDMALTKLPSIRTPLSADGVWLVPVSNVLRLGCLLSACSNPECPCTELVMSAYALDERVQAFGFKNGKLVCSNIAWDEGSPAPERPMTLRLDVETGELSGYEDRPLDRQDRRVAAIADALDAEMLDELEALWRRQKGFASRSGRVKAEIAPWMPGELVYWDAVFEVDRPETFLDAGRRVVALDMYCVAPSCDCRGATIAFYEEVLPNEKAPPPIGRVVVSFTGKLSFEPASPSGDARLRALWARYRRRHPALHTLLDRYAKLRAFAAEHTARSAAAPRPSAIHVKPAGATPVASLPGAQPQRPTDAAARRWVSTSRKRNNLARR